MRDRSNAMKVSNRMCVALYLGLMALLFSSCVKERSSSELSVLLSESPGRFDAISVDIQGVEVLGGDLGTVMLKTTTGIYNLLDFTSGDNALIATGKMEPGTVSQIRLILGPNNSVTIHGVTYPLSTASTLQVGLKLQVRQTLEPGVSYSVFLNFDANQSVLEKRRGYYQLRPVMQASEVSITGPLIGTVASGVISDQQRVVVK